MHLRIAFTDPLEISGIIRFTQSSIVRNHQLWDFIAIDRRRFVYGGAL